MKYLVVSLHDCHPGSLRQIQEQIQTLEPLGVRHFSILVVPQWHFGKSTRSHHPTVEFLRQRLEQGDDLVLHGYYHLRPIGWNNVFWTRLYTSHECEFLDLSEGEARHRIEMGRRLWDEQGWPLHGFIAPAWLMPLSQNALLRRLGFLYTVRLRRFDVLPRGRVTESQSLCYSTRSAWRRVASHLWNPILYQRLRGRDFLRLSLHPRDLEFPPLRQQITELVQMALADGYQPITYARYAQM